MQGVCDVATAEVCDEMSSPFWFYLSIAFGLKLPPVCGLCTAGAAARGRRGGWWPREHAEMAAGERGTVQMEKGSDIEEDRTFYQADSSNTRNDSAVPINEKLCHDPLVVVYILVGCAFIIWQFEGISRNDHGYNNSSFGSNVLLRNFTFITLGGVAFCCFAMCLWRRR
eukprot:15323760-Ditylum_brightwellii.AAC.1